jgi:cytochrome o ubiquinol oxidase operon protein cyoD
MYISGFVLSLLLTGAAYLAVTQKLWSAGLLIGIIIALAIAQVLVQLFFFLHLGQETKPRWKLIVLIAMLGVLGILVIGSLWIMQNLNYHMMSPQEMNLYMLDQNGRGF